MTNCPFKNIEEMKDPVSHFVYGLLKGYGIPSGLAFRFIRYGARDHARVPMAWDDSVNGGFNQGCEPWQCVDPSYEKINVKKDLDSERSIYRFYQKILKIRKEHEAAVYGTVTEYDHENKRILAYSREYEGKKLFIAANFSKRKVTYGMPEWVRDAALLINNYESVEQNGSSVTFRPYQALVFECI